MPPKLRSASDQAEGHPLSSGVGELDMDEYSVSSPLDGSHAATAPARVVTMTDTQLQLMLTTVVNSMSLTSPAPPPPKLVKVEVPKLGDDESPSEFFTKWEQALGHNGMPRTAWADILPVYLLGRAQSAYQQIHPDLRMDYLKVKNELSKLLGDTPDAADKKWWLLARKGNESLGDMFQRVFLVATRRMDGFDTKLEIMEREILSRYLSLLQPDCYTYVIARKPKTGQAAAVMAQEFEDERSFASKLGHKGSSSGGSFRPQYSTHQWHRPSGQSNGSAGSSQGVHSENKDVVKSPRGSTPPKEADSRDDGRSDSPRQDRWQKRKPIICHGCGKPGHIRPQCPDSIRRMRSPEFSVANTASNAYEIGAWIAGEEVTARVDSGADLTLVHESFIPENAYVKGVVRVSDFRGQYEAHKRAKVKIRVGEVEQELCVVVINGPMDYPVLLGCDLCEEIQSSMYGLLNEKAVMRLAEKKLKKNEAVGTVRVATRAQAAKQAAEVLEDAVLSEESECSPNDLSTIFDFPDSFFDRDPIPTPASDVNSWPEEGLVDPPLPEICCSDSEKLGQEQRADPTLAKLCQLALDGELGYAFEDDVLVRFEKDEFEEYVRRIAVPMGRREQVLRLAHSDRVSGHFGSKKTLAKVKHHFFWPGMRSTVSTYVRQCEACQRAAPVKGGRAPLSPLPCVSEPFSTVAFDIVGPLPVSASGHRYILTCMCLFSKFPDAIPLRRCDNDSVCDALIEIFSRYGVPKCLLTDQGSVFTSQLTRQLCKAFGILKVQTSPYHPQSNGALERWHACLKGMMKRADLKVKLWDVNLRYLLFAYRDTPHCVTGFSPYVLMFGREGNGPLKFLSDSWLSKEDEVVSVEDYLILARDRMSEAAAVVSEKEKVAKEKMKQFYDRKAVVTSFEPGDKVLVRKPILRGKLQKAWLGPYVVEAKVSPITYLVKVGGALKKGKVLHRNLLKRFVEPMLAINRVVLVEDEEGEPAFGGLQLVCGDFVPSPQQQSMLDAVLARYDDVFSDTPGRTKLGELRIRTGDHTPVSSHPYRVPPRWLSQVKAQIDQLIEMGIVVPSSSPWSSSIVPVKKKNGGVRVCVDFRAVNALTSPDPYQMPRIEDILEQLAKASFLSKVDLTKGFHQIPIHCEDREKTAFCTPWGKFSYVYMPFGLRNGPAAFQRLMDVVLHEDLDWSRVYIDDIVIFSTSWEGHCQHIGKVLQRLRDAGLTINAAKCQWGQTNCEFLGHVVGKGLVSPAELKTKAVRDFPVPVSKRQVRQFLGLTGYYRRFIPKYAEHSFLLTEATRKIAPDKIVVCDDLLAEFFYLKEALCGAPALTLPTVTDVFLLQTDALGVGIGAVLSVLREGEEFPVAFFSRKLEERERRYCATELEGLAVVEAVGHFEVYLITHPFTIETDHRALSFLNSAHHQNGRLARWAIRLQPFTFEVVYRPGALNGNADSLSRSFSSSPTSSDILEGGEDVLHPTAGAGLQNIEQ